MELESRRCWSDGLPHDLFGDILSRLELDDRIRFAAVCTNWTAVADEYPLAMPKSPWLMLPGGGCNDGMEDYRNLYRLSDQKVLRLHLPHIRDWRFIGSCDGWLVAIDYDRADLHIINPLTRVVNRLPPTSTFCFLLGSERNPDNGQITGYYINDGFPVGTYLYDMEYFRQLYVFKAMFFPSASITIAIHGIQQRKLAFARPGDESWNQIELDMVDFCQDFDDMILHKGVFYAVTHKAFTIGLDLNDCPMSPPKIAFQGPDNFPQINDAGRHFLVQTADDLLLLGRYAYPNQWVPNEENYDGPSYIGKDVYKTDLFKIYKIDPISFQWIELTNLGDDVALFVGNNHSMSLNTKDLPELKGNSIYFTEDYETYFDVPHVRRDIGVFSLEDGTIEPFFPDDDSLLHRLNWPPPLWITPSLS